MKVEITTANIRNKVVKVDNAETVKAALVYYVENVLIPLKMFSLSTDAWEAIKIEAMESETIFDSYLVELINCSCKNALYKITKVTTQVF